MVDPTAAPAYMPAMPINPGVRTCGASTSFGGGALATAAADADVKTPRLTKARVSSAPHRIGQELTEIGAHGGQLGFCVGTAGVHVRQCVQKRSGEDP